MASWLNHLRLRPVGRVAESSFVGYNPGYVVTRLGQGVAMLFSRQEMIRRIGLLRSAKLIFDLLVAALLLWQGWGWLPLLVLSADVAILWLLYPRLSQRQPVAAVLTTLLLTALLVLAALYDRPALAPLLLAFNVPLPAVAAVALGSGVAVLAAAGLATLATVAAMALAWQLLGEGAPVLVTWTALTVGAIWLQALALRQFVLEERRQRTPFDAAASIANGLTVVTVNDAIFETPTEVLAKLLRRQADNSGVRWLVLDLATSTPVTPTEIERLTQAARNVANCKVVLARVPAAATLQPGAPLALLKRLDHFATVTQAVEVGLRHLGWVHPATTPEAREARQPIRIPTSVVSEDWWDAG